MSQGAKDIGLSAEERRTLHALIEELGERAVLAELSVSRQALGRALAGLSVRRGTIALVRAGLASPNLRAKSEEPKDAIHLVGSAAPQGDDSVTTSQAERSTGSRRSP
ncbi:hypothetical protein WMF27_40985 [Sorangium sp. So ce281]|uniref:hypothetical protein n=1 Tax=unclassified Sorangium TaxID=2621164 RepID=UPI003F6359B1